MPSLKDLKNRIGSVKSTRKITRAMQMVAAAKLRRAQETVEAGRPYAEEMGRMVSRLAQENSEARLLVGTGKQETYLLIVATAERGLCGGFNSSIVKMAKERARRLRKDGKTVKILTVGRKGREQLLREWGDHFVGHIDLSDAKNPGYEHARRVVDAAIRLFNDGEFDVCTMIYARFHSVITQTPVEKAIIPALICFESEEEVASGPEATYEYEPEEEEILADLIPRNIAVQVYHALLENAASEHGARMSAMDSATRNAGEMIDKLTLEYNRTRQAFITKELIEIISGAEAL